MKQQYIKPTTYVVENESLMAGKCNEQFIYTSKGGASNGFAKVCYHFRIPIPYTEDKYGYKNDVYADAAMVINIPAGAVFRTDHTIEESGDVEGRHYFEGGAWLYEYELGWRDFEGANGTCHFIGDIYINGERVTPSNVNRLCN